MRSASTAAVDDLGLAIARQLVAAHGGQIAAHSEVGKGTTIRLTLPLEHPD